MEHAVLINGQPTLLHGRVYVDSTDIAHVVANFQHWNREEKLAIGVYELERQTVPEGSQAVDWVLTVEGDIVTATPILEPLIPLSVTRAQGKAALIQAGLWAAVVGFVDGIADPTEKALAEVALNDALEWKRSSPFLNATAAALDIDSEGLDDLFRAAAEIEL